MLIWKFLFIFAQLSCPTSCFAGQRNLHSGLW